MKITHSLYFILALFSAVDALAADNGASGERQDIFKRKGGGGGGGRGGSSGGSRSSGSSGSRSGSSSSSGSSGSSSGKSSSSGSSGSVARGSSSSNVGGRTTTGSGPTPRFGGGSYYAGGAKVPYRSGAVGPSGIIPIAILGGGLLFWSGAWLAGAYMYSYTHDYTFQNLTADPVLNETLPVHCVCQPYVECGCEDTEDMVWLDDIIGNGSIAALNDTLVFVGEVNGTKAIYINGTLPNGTTASGGDEDPSAAVRISGMLGAVGFWPVALAVGAAVFL